MTWNNGEWRNEVVWSSQMCALGKGKFAIMIAEAPSYRPVFEVSGQWYDNGARYASPADAAAAACARFQAWTVPSDWGVAPADEEPNR